MSTPDKNGIIRRDCQHTLRFQTIKELHHAVLVYGGAVPLALNKNLKQIGERYSKMSVAFNLTGLPQNSGSFAEKVVEEIGDLSSGWGYCGSWDCEGPGPFHKCSINADRNEDGTFSLDISAAYVNNIAAVELARRIGAPIGYGYCTIERTYETSGDRFAIPVKDIEAAYTALGQSFNREKFLKAFTTPTMSGRDKSCVGSYTSSVLVVADKDAQATIGLTSWRSVAADKYKDAPTRDYEYRIENKALTGPANIGHDGKPEAIGLTLSIRPNVSPTYDKALEQRIRDMGDVVEVTWKASLASVGAKPSRVPRPWWRLRLIR